VLGDDIPSDNIVEILTDDIGGTFSSREFGGVEVPTLEALVLAAVTDRDEGLVGTLFAPLDDTTTSLAYNSGDGNIPVVSNGPYSTATSAPTASLYLATAPKIPPLIKGKFYVMERLFFAVPANKYDRVGCRIPAAAFARKQKSLDSMKVL